jgi:predicted alpha/beta hydrolase family esterase
MPCKDNANYTAWKIWFERHFDFIHDQTPTVIGHSLGCTFLLKYLSENKFPKQIKQLHLVAPWVNNDIKVLPLERVASFAFDINKINVLEKMAEEIHIWHSEDDDVVPFSDSEMINKKLPKATLHRFTDRKHFIQPAFLELLQSIQR